MARETITDIIDQHLQSKFNGVVRIVGHRPVVLKANQHCTICKTDHTAGTRVRVIRLESTKAHNVQWYAWCCLDPRGCEFKKAVR